MIDFRLFEVGDLEIYLDSYLRSAECWDVPYYWQTPLALLREPTLIAKHKGFILLSSHRCMGRYTMKLKFPPVPCEENPSDLEDVIEDLLSEGISINGFAEDIPQSYIKRSSAESAITSKQLIVYRKENYTGKIGRMIRRYQDKLDDGELSVSVSDGYDDEAYRVCRDWSLDKFGKIIPEFQYIEHISKFPYRLVIHWQNGEPVHLVSCLLFGKGKAIGTHNLGVTRKIYPSLNFSLLSDYEIFRQTPHLNCINAGSSRSPGIAYAKSRLQSEYKTVRRIKPYIEMDKEAWENYRP